VLTGAGNGRGGKRRKKAKEKEEGWEKVDYLAMDDEK